MPGTVLGALCVLSRCIFTRACVGLRAILMLQAETETHRERYSDFPKVTQSIIGGEPGTLGGEPVLGTPSA